MSHPDELADNEASSPTGAGAAVAHLRSVFGNPDLRRVQLAFFGSVIGDWAYATAIMVYAYQEGGATLLGLWAGARMMLQAVAAPLGAAVADRMSRRTFMLINDFSRLVLVIIVALLMYAGADVAFILVVATVVSLIGVSFRAAQAGLIPQLVKDPRQLTANNATAELLESAAGFFGPALGGLLLSVFNVEVVILVNAVSFAWSLAMVYGVRRVVAEPEDAGADNPADDEFGRATSIFREAGAGFAELRKDRDLIAFSGLVALNGILAGALSVILVIVASEVFGNAAAVGYFNALIGVGTVAGGFFVLSRVGSIRLGRAMVIGVLGWCLPLLLIGLLPYIVVTLGALLLVGLADPLINVGFGTIPQRLVRERVMSRVFGALESVLVAAMAVGAFLVPLMVRLTSWQMTLVVLGGACALLAALTAARMTGLDRRMEAPPELELVQALPLFAPLSPVTQESLARRLDRLELSAGTPVVTEGSASDRFYLIVSGEVEVSQGGRVLRHESDGDFFGEIGLLHDVARTATVTTTRPTVLQTLSRQDFLEALTQDQAARGMAEEVARKRLAG